jgi:KDO2-lipid IV(A) lauroyltransferase
MKKPRSRSIDFAVYLLIRLTVCVLQALPMTWSLRVIHWLARVACHVDRRHRRVAMENLRLAFPGAYTEDQLRRLTLDVYRHFFTVALEMMFIPRKLGSRRRREELMKITPELERALSSGRPLLMATAHFGNWELNAFLLRYYGIRAHLVARPMDNPYLDAYMRRFRESMGHKVVSKNGELARMRDVLLDGGCLCTLVDQDAGPSGLFVDFFGRPASTHKAIAHLARWTSALIVVAGVQNLGGTLDYAVRDTDIIDPDDYARQKDAVLAITQRFTKAVERLVRYDPRQYFWLHQRWKHQPPAVVPGRSVRNCSQSMSNSQGDGHQASVCRAA